MSEYLTKKRCGHVLAENSPIFIDHASFVLYGLQWKAELPENFGGPRCFVDFRANNVYHFLAFYIIQTILYSFEINSYRM